MSDTEWNKRETPQQWGAWIFRYLLGAGVLVICWFCREIWQNQRDLKNDIQIINIDRASERASKFTASDWNAAKTLIDAQFNAVERRTFKLENSAERVNESLQRIETKLGTK